MLLIKNGYVKTVGPLKDLYADILIENNKIIKIDKDINEEGAIIIDASDKIIYPGIVEAHCHIGMHEAGIGFEGNDTNEMSHDPITPQLRGYDAINPFDDAIIEARKGGITTCNSGPGSANVVGGTFTCFKTVGTCIDEMMIKPVTGMKCAFGENPKRVYQSSKLMTRMQIASSLRELLEKTKEYINKKEAAKDDTSKLPAYDAKLEAMIPVIKKEIPLKAHAHRTDDIATSIRIAKEFDVLMTLDHCTEGHMIADVVKNSGFPAIVGPSLTAPSKYELRNKTFATANVLYQAGVEIAITTDSPVVPQEYLPLSAALCIKEGLPEEAALEAITINPAKILGLSHRIGSIEVGKDADIVICDKSIFDVSNVISYTIIDGKVAYKA